MHIEQRSGVIRNQKKVGSKEEATLQQIKIEMWIIEYVSCKSGCILYYRGIGSCSYYCHHYFNVVIWILSRSIHYNWPHYWLITHDCAPTSLSLESDSSNDKNHQILRMKSKWQKPMVTAQGQSLFVVPIFSCQSYKVLAQHTQWGNATRSLV